MKIRDAVVWPWRWSTLLGSIQENAPVEDGILIEARVWVGTFNITLVVECADGRYYGSIRMPSREAFPRRNRGLRLRDVIEKEIDFAETVH